jgi:hypothetical protein
MALLVQPPIHCAHGATTTLLKAKGEGAVPSLALGYALLLILVILLLLLIVLDCICTVCSSSNEE